MTRRRDRATGQWQVSTTGGAFPVWRPDGKELYYLNPAGAMMAAPITIAGATVEPGAPVLLFPTHIAGGGVEAQQARQYDVARDGRFLINAVAGGASTAPITLLMNTRFTVIYRSRAAFQIVPVDSSELPPGIRRTTRCSAPARSDDRRTD